MSFLLSLWRIGAVGICFCVAVGLSGCGTVSIPADLGDVEPDDAVVVEIFSNDNRDAVFSGPLADTEFTITKAYRITSIRTYHWNNGAGTDSLGSVSLLDSSGAEVGSWSCSRPLEQSSLINIYWECLPEVEIGPGTYTVVDSDPGTWSYNTASGGAGICIVKGFALDGEEPEETVSPSEEPEGIAKRFFDAQMAGDVDGMLEECAMHLVSAGDEAEMVGALELIRDRVNLVGSVFTHLATGYTEEGDEALVRCQHSVTVEVDGNTIEQEGGTLLWMVAYEDKWKIRNIYPDEVTALALAEMEGTLEKERQKETYTWQEISAKFSTELMTAKLNTPKAGLDAMASAVGAKPVVGDALSAWYTWGDIIIGSKEVAEDYQKGRFKSTLIGISSVGWGFLQILAEPVPVLDHAADGVGALLDQAHNWVQQKENYLIVLGALKRGDFSTHEKYLTLRSSQTLPDGIELTLAEDWKVDGLAITGIAFLTDEAIRSGGPLVFDVVAQLGVSNKDTPDYFLRAVAMGAPTTSDDDDEIAWLGAQITDMVSDASGTGAGVLVQEAVSGTAGLRYRMTATRGFQELVATVRSITGGAAGTTVPVEVENRVFNAVDGIAVGVTRDTATTELSIMAGESLAGMQVFGTISDLTLLPGVEPPLLTLVDSVRIGVDDAEVVTFLPSGSWPEATLEFEAHKRGTAWLSVYLESGSDIVPNLESSMLITVEDEVHGVWRLADARTSHDSWEERVDYLDLYAFAHRDLGNSQYETAITRTDSTDVEESFTGIHGWSGLAASQLVPGEILSVTLSAAADHTVDFPNDFSTNLQAQTVFTVPDYYPYTYNVAYAGYADSSGMVWTPTDTEPVSWSVPEGEFDGQELVLVIEMFDWGALDDTPGNAQEYNKVVVEYQYVYEE